MATPREHKAKAIHSEEFLQIPQFTEDKFADWAVTVLFYTALHWMRALAAQEGHQVRSYRDEDGVFKGTGVFSQGAYDWYRQLRDDSRDARYEMKPFSVADFSDLQQNYFVPFKAFVTSRLLA